MNFPLSNDLNSQKYYIDKYGSIEKLIDKAKNGEIHAQADLGCAYSQGFGDLLPQDNDKAIGWLSTAIDKGYELPHALGKLGELLDRKGTIRHQQKAYEMYRSIDRLLFRSSIFIDWVRPGCTTGQRNWGAEVHNSILQKCIDVELKES